MKEKYRCKKRALFQITKVLWHLDIFRRSFRELSGHACMQESCIFCALKELFAQLQFSQESALPPDALRRALAESFFDQQRFQLGFMDDAAECFENILLRIHYHIASHEAEDMCSAQHCIPHQKFAMTLVEQSVCGKCGATSEPLPFTQMVHYVSASALIAQATSFTPYDSDMFSQLLNKAGAMGDIRDCPSACGAKIQICRTLMNKPDIVSVGIVWDSEQPTLAHIMSVFATVGTNLRLSDLFHSVVDSRWAVHTEHALVGVVTYYGKHYSTFFFHTKLRMWIYFDDATVREVGPRWDQVVDKCRRGRYQPLLLLYAAPGGTPINAESAPKTTAAADMWMGQRNLTNARRAMTPDPDRPVGDYQNLTDMQALIFSQQRQQKANDCVDGTVLNPPRPRTNDCVDGVVLTHPRPRINDCVDGVVLNHPRPRTNDCVDGAIMNHQRFNNDAVDPLIAKNNADNSSDFYGRRVDSDGLGVPRLVRRDSGSSGNSSSTDRHLRRVDSNSSSGGPTEGGLNNVLERLNLPRRRDSGNWSGDRNSASSSSSTSMDNPYLYILSKAKSQNGPRSPTSIKPGEVSSSSSGPCDAGYDSYSLSSTDSLSLQTGLKHNLQLAQIPEGYLSSGTEFPQPFAGDDCEKLCREADQLLEKSVATEEANDLTTALVLCQAAVSKARKAMDAPYHNDKTYCIARLKHTTCVMRMRSLHRRLVSEKQSQDGVSNTGSGNHSRQNSRDKSSGSHSRQNSKDGSQTGPVHSRQNSREGLAGSGRHNRHNSRENLLSAAAAQAAASQAASVAAVQAAADKPTNKTIQIYGTLPKSKKSPSIVARTNSGSGSSSSGSPAAKSRFEDEEYILYDRPGRESRFTSRNKKAEEKVREKRTRSEERANVSAKQAAPETKDKKKQHKIRRKLLMGGLIRRKNRSMPDLREDENNGPGQTATLPAKVTLDESALSLNGYLSEGHLEYSGNPNLERSRLMRKSFHGSAGKVLHAAKVPPPPPLRTTSQLSGTNKRPQLPLPQDKDDFHPAFRGDSSTTVTSAFRYESAQYANGGVLLNQQEWRGQSPVQASELLVTKAQIHCEASEVVGHSLDLPPYPSPAASICHSRQASDEFPPPPSPSDLSRLAKDSLLRQVQEKRLPVQNEPVRRDGGSVSDQPSGDSWLRELQSRLKGVNMSNYDDTSKTSVRDLASQFEGRSPIDPRLSEARPQATASPSEIRAQPSPVDARTQAPALEGRPQAQLEPRPQPLVVETRSQQPLPEEHEHKSEDNPGPGILTKSKSSTSLKSIGLEGKKKKNVTFCDQVVLVATADDEETDDYIPNPILERVLRGAGFHSKKDSSYSAPPQREIRSLKDEAPIADSVQTKLDMQRAEQKQALALNGSDSPNLQRSTNGPIIARLPVQRAVPHKVYQPPPHVFPSRPPYHPPPQYQTNGPSSQPAYPPNPQVPYQTNSQPMYQTTMQTSHQPSSQPPHQPTYQTSSQTSYQTSSQLPYQTPAQPPYQPNSQAPYQTSSQPTYQTTNPQPSPQPNTQLPHQTNPQPSHQTSSQPSYQASSQPAYPSNSQTPHPSNSQPPYQSNLQPPYQTNSQTPYQSNSQHPYQTNSQASYPNTSHSPYPVNVQPPYQPAPQPPYQAVPQPAPSAYQSVPQTPYQSVPQTPYQPVPQNPYQNSSSYQPHNQSPYQPVPQKQSNPGPYQTVPQLNIPQNRAPYYHSQTNGGDVVNGPPAYNPPPPAANGPVAGTYSYQRIASSSPVPNGTNSPSPYQLPPPPRQPPITSNGTSAGVSHPCNLCRKKIVASPAIYCTDCDFYMSRFKPKE